MPNEEIPYPNTYTQPKMRCMPKQVPTPHGGNPKAKKAKTKPKPYTQMINASEPKLPQPRSPLSPTSTKEIQIQKSKILKKAR